jgi:hypothetical protein
MRRGRLPVWAALAVATATPAWAQVPRVVEPAARPGFLSRFDYHMAIETLSGDDPQFQWDADFGGEFDVYGAPRARFTTAFNYEMVLGEELQPFDPVQGNYAIELLGARRWGRLEGAVVFHHTSRHLSDRAKDFGIAWNLLGGQATWSAVTPDTTWQLQARGAAALTHDFVDYSGEFSAQALYRHALTSRIGVSGWASLVTRTIDGDVSPRRPQTGGRLEAALRVRGDAAVLEIFAGWERRIEADAFIARPMSWALLGLRLTGPDRRKGAVP